MAASRFFSEVSDADLVRFCEENENENTKKKTVYDLAIFRDYLDSIDERREVELLSFGELQNILMKFVLAVKKKNGEEYEPSSIRAMIQSIDRHLKRKNYGASILHDQEFAAVQDILKKKQKELKAKGKGNKPNAAEPLTDDDIEKFYAKKVLGNHAPRPLLNTLWLNNCVFFGMRPGKEQRDLSWGDLQLKTDSSGARFIEFSTERQTKTRTGENPRNRREVKPAMYENTENPERCPVLTYLKYKEERPPEMCRNEAPFYLAINIEVPKPGKMWFKNSALGVNSLRNMMKNMQKDAGLETDRKIVNHSTRKHLIQKLVDSEIPPNEIIQITGHKNVNSINNYSTLSATRQQQISAILSNSSRSVNVEESSSSSSTSSFVRSSAPTPSNMAVAPLPSFLQNCTIQNVNIHISQTDSSSGNAEYSVSTSHQVKRRRIIFESSSEEGPEPVRSKLRK